MDYTVDSFVSKMVKAIFCIAVLMIAAGAAFFRSYYAVGFGLGVGMSLALNISKITWLKYCVNRAANMAPGAAGAYISIHYILRYILTGLVLAAAHFLPVVSMFGAAIGLLSMPFGNYAVHFLNRNNAPTEDIVSEDSVPDETAPDVAAVDSSPPGDAAPGDVAPDDLTNDDKEEPLP